jgi:hypothetical protein
MKRTVLLGALLAFFLGALLEPGFGRWHTSALDPLAPGPRRVEAAIASRRFADALPLAADLRRVYPNEPLVAYWLAEIYGGLGRAEDEASAWKSYRELAGQAESTP